MRAIETYRSGSLKAIIVGCLFLSGSAMSYGQKKYTYNTQAWVSYFTHLRVSDRWTINFDGSVRTKDHVLQELSQSLVRLGGSYHINKNLRATAGYAYSVFYPNETHPLTKRMEHRPYQMIQWMREAGKFRFLEVGRLEQRFRQRIVNGAAGDSYSFVQRIRLASTVFRSLSTTGFGPNRFSVSAGFELFYNVGKEVLNNGFDQLRASANVQYQVSETNTITAGYLYQVQQFPKGDGYNKLNAIRINFIQQLDLRKHKI